MPVPISAPLGLETPQSCCQCSTCCTSNNSPSKGGKLNITVHTALGNSHLNLPCAPCEKLTACGHRRLAFQPSPQKPLLSHPVIPSGIAHTCTGSGRAFLNCKWVSSKCPSCVCSHCKVPPYQLLPQTSAGRRALSFSPHIKLTSTSALFHYGDVPIPVPATDLTLNST